MIYDFHILVDVMKKIIKTFVISSLLYSSILLAQKGDYAYIGITAGKVGAFTPDRRSDRYGIEYRAKPFSKWQLIPAFGIAWNTHDSRYVYSELKHDWNLKHNLVFTGSLGVGIFDSTNNLDLGHPVEFRTGFELSYRFKNNYRLGVAAYHLSNSRLSQKNPGTEAIALSLLIPIHRK